MTIDKKRNGSHLEIVLKGRLDTLSAAELELELLPSLHGISTLSFDFSGVEYITSAGLRVLLVAQNAMQEKGGMKIMRPNKLVMDLFKGTGFADVLTVE